MSLTDLPKPFFVLAPMDDVTDTVFRRVVDECAVPDIYFTEFVNVDGLQSSGRKNLLKKLQFTAQERPIIAQIWGKNPENYYKTAQQIADGSLAQEANALNNHDKNTKQKPLNFAGIDLNMGCPDKKIVKNGCCAAFINDRKLAGEVIEATQKGASINKSNGRQIFLPVSVKTRLGFNEIDYTWHEFLLGYNLDMLTVHGRTKKQMSKVPANWDALGRIRKLRDNFASETLIVGNGDVMSRSQGVELTQQYGLDGIMIGRGVFSDPYVFSKKSPWLNMSKQDRIDLYKKHVELFASTWNNRERPIQTLNKFCKIYINHFDGAKELREKLMNAKTTQELLGLLIKA
ncbi:MAG: tRNA-dihydrouridine synthase [Candidatus Saccharibacteria bacterium]|nr:tRNA-dihydrouridine synthase [Candidatus Saccharibacteria bacterium]